MIQNSVLNCNYICTNLIHLHENDKEKLKWKRFPTLKLKFLFYFFGNKNTYLKGSGNMSNVV